MTNPLVKKLRGYQKAPRDRFKLLKDGKLTCEEFVLYELGIAITDWDLRHERYGFFKATDQEIAEILCWKSRSTVCKHRNSLIKKGYFEQTQDGLTIVKGFEDWELRRNFDRQMATIEKDKNELVAKFEQLNLRRAELQHDENVAKVVQNFDEEIEQEVSIVERPVAKNQRDQTPSTNYALSSSKGEFITGAVKEPAITETTISSKELDNIIAEMSLEEKQ